jgi:hypothetical protein
MQPYQQTFLEERHGFRAYSPAEDAKGMPLSRAQHLVETSVEQPIQFEIGRVLVNDDLIYVPYGWVGCLGFLVHRRTERVILLGSVLVPHQWVWAFYRGFSLGETAADRQDTLVIRAVHQPRETVKTFRWLMRREPKFKRLGRQLRTLPCIIRDVDLLFAVRELMVAEEKQYFDFEINPTDLTKYERI